MPGDLYFVLEYRGQKTSGYYCLLISFYMTAYTSRISETTNEILEEMFC